MKYTKQRDYANRIIFQSATFFIAALPYIFLFKGITHPKSFLPNFWGSYQNIEVIFYQALFDIYVHIGNYLLTLCRILV